MKQGGRGNRHSCIASARTATAIAAAIAICVDPVIHRSNDEWRSSGLAAVRTAYRVEAAAQRKLSITEQAVGSVRHAGHHGHGNWRHIRQRHNDNGIVDPPNFPRILSPMHPPFVDKSSSEAFLPDRDGNPLHIC